MKLSNKYKGRVKFNICLLILTLVIVVSCISVATWLKQTDNQISKTVEAEDTAFISNAQIISLNASETTSYGLSVRNKNLKVTETLNIDVIDSKTKTVVSNQGDFTWTSSNNDVASINNNGEVTGRAVGHTTITAHGPNGIKARAMIHVYRNVDGAITVPQLEVGDCFTLALKEDGTVWTVGYNGSGQLGNGSTANSSSFVQVKIDENRYLTNVISTSVFRNRALALTKDGYVYAWGANAQGQLGQGNTSSLSYATKVKGINGEGVLQNIIDVKMENYACFAVDEDGNVYCWGTEDQSNCLGEGCIKTPRKLNKVSDAITVFGGCAHTGVITASGNTYVWGYNHRGQLGRSSGNSTSLIDLGNDIDQVVMRGFSTFIVKEDHKVYATGLNENGQLGFGDRSNRSAFAPILLENGTQIYAKYVYSATHSSQIITTSGDVLVAGDNGYRKLSIETTSDSTYFKPMRTSDTSEFTDVLFGANGGSDENHLRNMGLIKNDGTIWLSGDNSYGQYGNESKTASPYIVQVGTSQIEVNARNEFIRINQTLDIEILSASAFNVFIQPNPNPTDFTWTSSNPDVAQVNNLGSVIGKSVGYTTITASNQALGIKVRAIVNVHNQNNKAITVPQVVNETDCTIVLKEDGTVWSCGNNGSGQLGDGTNISKNQPVQVKINEDTYLSNVVKIAGTISSTLAMTKDGRVYAWGANGGLLGVGNNNNQWYATLVVTNNGNPLENVIDIASGECNSLFLTKDGSTYICGSNGYNNSLGKYSGTVSSASFLHNDGAIRVLCAFNNAGEMLSNGQTVLWGSNDNGQFGTGTSGSGHTLGKTYIGNDIVWATMGGWNTAILKENGEVWVTGNNRVGQLGNGTTTLSTTFVKSIIPQNEKVKYLTNGAFNTNIMTESGKVYATGSNGYGQLAQGNKDNVLAFAPLKNSENSICQDALLIGAGTYSVSQGEYTRTYAIIRRDGTVWSSGDNTYGQIGNLSNTHTTYLTKMGFNEIMLNARNEYIKIDQTLDIDVLISTGFNVFIPKEERQSDWSWSSSNPDVAIVNNKGEVTGKKVGYTVITGYNSNSGLKGRAIINVYNKYDGAITTPQVVNEVDATIVLKEDGTVWSAGNNDKGQLGDGTNKSRKTLVQVKIDENTNLTNVKKIVGSMYWALALTRDGYVYSWGQNGEGQLAVGNTSNQKYATLVVTHTGRPLENIIDIATGECNSLFLSRSGETYFCGSNGYNNSLGKYSGVISSARFLHNDNAIRVMSAYNNCGEMLVNGDAVLWGSNDNGQFGTGTSGRGHTLGKTYLGNDIIWATMGGWNSAILKENGKVYVTGNNSWGQLGDGTNTLSARYVEATIPSNEKIKYLTDGAYSTHVMTESGKIYATGYNGYGQLAQGNKENLNVFTELKYSESRICEDALLIANGPYATSSSASSRMFSMIKEDGTVWSSGDNTYGQIGNNTNDSTTYLTKMGDGFLNYRDKIITMKINETKEIDKTLFSLEDDVNVFIGAKTDIGAISLTVEDSSIAELEDGKTVRGKAKGITRILVQDTVTGSTTSILVKVIENGEVQIDSGSKFTVALKQNGTVWTFGENSLGQLGLGNKTNYNKPQEVTKLTEKITAISAGYHHAAALTENGEVYTWGYNHYGQLGNGTTVDSLIPIKVNGLQNIVKIDCYKYMTIALNKSGEVFVWGNGYGANPVKLEFSKKVIDISGNIVLQEDRRAYDLNENNYYGKDLIKISAGENHYLGLTASGEVIAWGTNNYGQLGNGNNTSSNNPSKVLAPNGNKNIQNIVEISAGNSYSIITDNDGNIYTFGYNGDCRLAGGDTRNKPQKIEGLNKMELISASEGGHSVIADWDGFVYTVGQNDAGQLGLEDNNQRSTFEMIGEIQITSIPEKIILHQGESTNINLALNNTFNLKSNTYENIEIQKNILNQLIATLSGDTITGISVGRTILNASYEGIVGTINTDVKKYFKNIEIQVLPEGGNFVPKVVSGNGFTVALKSDGTVWTWGQGNNGQLGIGSTENYNEPQKVKIIKQKITNPDGTTTEEDEVIKDIAVGNNHVLATSESGKVYAWGLGTFGQLGIGNGYNQNLPVIVTDIYGKELEDIVKVEAHNDTSFAIDSKGRAYAWGKDYTTRAQKLDVVDKIVDITSKYVLSDDGKVYNIQTKSALQIVGTICELDEGVDHTVMLTDEGKAYAIGDNTYGQLGNGNNVPSQDTPVAVRISSSELFTNIKEIKAGDRYTIIVTKNGKVYTVGINDNNELGIPNTTILDRNLPEENTNIKNVIFAGTGDNHVTVIKDDGTVYSWGNGKLGQLGNRTNKNSINPVMVGDYIIRTNTNRVVLGVNDEKIVEGNVDYFNVFNTDVINMTFTSKDSSVVQLVELQPNEGTNGKIGIKLIGKKVGTTIVTANQENSTNIGVIQVEVIPEGKTISPNAITNGSHTITLRVDGKVFTYGQNTYGELGDGTTTYSDEPVEVKFPEGTIITQIASGENHNVALDSNGNVWTWGRNNYYQIGHSGGDQYTPYKIPGLPKIIRISAGNNNTMVLTENNELYSWGFNAYGDLGIGTYTNKALPTKVEGIKDIIDISGGKNHFIALNRSGEVFVTGSNLYGQLGNGNNVVNKTSEFEKVNLVAKAGTIDAGELSNAITTVDGYLYTWGGNTYGQLGTGDKQNRTEPTYIQGIENIRQVDMGKTHTILRDGNNNTFLVGTNTYGGLGIGTTDSKMIFEQNTKIDDVIRASAGNTYTVFVKSDGFVWACGDYNHGDKTKKSRTNSKVPILVGSDESSLDSLEIVLMKSEIKSIMANAKFKFNLIYIEENDTSKFSYTSFNEDIAKVNNDGDILGIREGTTWVEVVDGNTNKTHIAIVRVIDNNAEYQTHVAPKVVSGENFAMALKEDGTVWSWGYDASGLADTNIPSNQNVLSTYQNISAGKNHVLAIRTDGTVWVAGNNTYGQLGIGSNNNKAKLVQIEGLTDIKQIATGANHSLAMDSYGIVYGWGQNTNGELGKDNIGVNTTSPKVITIANDRIMHISAGTNQSAFVTTNGAVYGMGAFLDGYIPGIDNAVKVAVGDNYILVLRSDKTIYKYQHGILTKVSNVSNAIDIAVQNNINMYQSLDEKAYTWGINPFGQLGINSTLSKTIPTEPTENNSNVFSIGSGYSNTYIISNTGYVYAAGNNTYGELGNGTSENDNSPTKEESLVHTLVGDRNFEVVPETNTLELNEVEDITINSNTFNVFNMNERSVSDFNWDVEDSSIVTILADGQIKAADIGATNVLVEDKVTKEIKEARRVVVPIDTDRIELITADGKEASVTDVYEYEVKIPTDADTSTTELIIKTKLEEDEISLDNGITFTKGYIRATVNIPDRSTPIPFIVKTEAGNTLDYTVTIIRTSNDNTISNITVKPLGSTSEIVANQVSNNIYEAIVPNTGNHEIKVTANDINAFVSIKGLAKTKQEQTCNFKMENPVEELPIKVISESGREETYTLKLYTEMYLTTLNKVYVNGQEAIKQDPTNYKFILQDDKIDLSEIKAITNVSSSKVGINNCDKEVNQIIKDVQTIDDVTIVTIQVESSAEELEQEYTLTIYKKRTESMIQTVEVNNTEIQEINKIYTAYISSEIDQAEIKITAKNINYYITLGDYEAESYTITKTEDISQETTTYKIKINDNLLNIEEEYTLIIKRGDTEIGVKSVYAVNGNIIVNAKQIDDYEFEIRILDSFTDTNLTVTSVNPNGKIDIDGNGFVKAKNIKNISISDREVEVPFTIKAEDDGKEQTYTVKIIRTSDDTRINEIKVNELLGGNDLVAELSETEPDVYELNLEHPVNTIDIIANTVWSKAQIKVLDNNYSVHEDTKQISINSSLTEVIITVQSEYGTEKQYTLKINTLPDDTSIQTIIVEGKTAVYNNNTGRYEVRLKNTYTNYGITVSSSDSDATILINAKSGAVSDKGTVQATENKTIDTTLVPIIITAQNGIEVKEYTLAIIEQSDISDIGIVKVNNIIIEPQQDGNYIANVTSTTNEAEIFVEALNQFAKVTLDGQTNNTNNITITRSITSNKITYNIEVLSEDETSTNPKTLTINRLSGNTDITEVKVITSENTYTAALQPDGTYYTKIKREASAEVTITADDSKAKVSIAGGNFTPQVSTGTITLLNDITEVNAMVEAEDGTRLPVIIKIEKESDDATLAKLLSNDAIKIKYIGNDKYEIQVYDTLQTLTIDAITNNNNAKIKLATESDSDYVIHEMKDKQIDLSTGITSFKIHVLPECGGLPKEYTIQITKVFSTLIKSIVTDGDIATKNETIYDGWINIDNTANIVITPDNLSANVSIYKEGKLLASGTGVLTIADTVIAQTDQYKIIVEEPVTDGSHTEYILNVTKKSTNNNIGFVKVNGETLTENTINVDTLGNYYVEVGTTQNNEYELQISAENEYATLKIDDGEYSDSNIVSKKYTILPNETKEITFVIKSQNGEEAEEKTVKIYRKDNNLNILTVKIGETDITSSYDAIHKNYSIILENTESLVDLEIDVESDKTQIESTIDGTNYNDLGLLKVTDVELPGVGKKVITFTITSEEGTEETRTITISQFSSDVSLEELKVNGIDATKRDDGNFEIIIGDSCGNAQIYAKTVEETSTVGINRNSQIPSSSTVTINNIIAGNNLEVPIKVQAQDGTEYTYMLYITIKSGDNQLEYVKVNGNDVEALSETKFRAFVGESEVQATIDIKALDNKSIVKTTVNGIPVAGNAINFVQLLPQENAEIKFVIISESNEEKEYTLTIIKQSSDNTLKYVYVNGEEVEINNETGRYVATIYEEEGNPTVKVVTNNEFAYVRIGLSKEYQEMSEEQITLANTKITTVPITIRSQTGVTNVEYLDIEVIYTQSKIDTLIVDDKEITNYDEQTKTYTAVVPSDISIHEIFVMCANSYATLEINDDVGVGNVTTYTNFETEILEKILTLRVTSESNETQEYNIKLIKSSSNINIAALYVNDVTIAPEEDHKDIYRKNIKKLADRAKIKVVTEYPYANVKIGDCTPGIGVSEQWIDLSLAEDFITIPVLVTATDGETIATYNIILKRVSNDTTITISYDGTEVLPNQNGEYKVSILDTVTSGTVIATTNNSNAKVDIASEKDYQQGSKQYDLVINTETADRYIEIPINIIAEDETPRTETLIITRMSTDTNTSKVEGTYEVPTQSEEGETIISTVTKEAKLDDEDIYIIGVKESTNEVLIKITAQSEFATITRDTDLGTGELEFLQELTDIITTVEYQITAEAGGTPQSKTIKIVKLSADTTISKLMVDGNEIVIGEDGIFHASVIGDTTQANVVVTTTIDGANIQIGKESNLGILDTNVEVIDIDNTYKIKITAEDGTEKEYTLEITRQTNIAGKIITENVNKKYKSLVTIYKTDDIRKEDEDVNLGTKLYNSADTSIRAVIAQVETEDDGSFVIEVSDIEKYDLVVTKAGYLDYRIIDIEVIKGKITLLDDYNLIAGDTARSGEIEIDDLVDLNDNFGVIITEANKEDKLKFDLNEDGIVNSLDRNILKKNYSKKAETIKWINPNAPKNGGEGNKEKLQMLNEGAENINNKPLTSTKSSTGTNKTNETTTNNSNNQTQNTKSANTNKSTQNAEQSTTSQTDYIKPMKCSYRISSDYGYRVHPVTGETKLHTGLDIVGTWHTEILSIADGEITYAGVQNGYGNCIEIKHIVKGVTIYSFYAHLSQINVQVGQKVKQGEIIGLEGGAETDPNHGTSTGHHLHFELRSASGSGHSLNPNDYIKF